MSNSGNFQTSNAAEPATQFSTGTGVGTLDAQFSDTVDLTSFTTIRGLYIGASASGTLKVNDWDGNAVTFANVTQGAVLPIRPRRIWATGTTVTNVVGLR